MPLQLRVECANLSHTPDAERLERGNLERGSVDGRLSAAGMELNAVFYPGANAHHPSGRQADPLVMGG